MELDKKYFYPFINAHIIASCFNIFEKSIAEDIEEVDQMYQDLKRLKYLRDHYRWHFLNVND